MTLRAFLLHAPPGVSRRDAETLLLHVLERDRAWLLAHPEALLSADQQTRIAALLGRRAQEEPLQYLTGRQEFFGLDLRVTPEVLIPRPETEHLVEAVLTWAKEGSGRQPVPLRLLDVGTGSGAIALALATHLPHAEIVAVDLSPHALAVAQANAARLGLGLEERLRFVTSDLLEALAPDLVDGLRFDAVVANPPYIPLVDAAELASEVRDFEPHDALFAGPDGLAIYRRLIPQASAALRAGGLLAMELGYGQREAIEALFRAQPAGQWSGWEFYPDLQGIPRVVKAFRA